jgi:hypothetical protein
VRSAALSCRSVASCSNKNAESRALTGDVISIMRRSYSVATPGASPPRRLRKGGLNAYEVYSLDVAERV